jgi:hypothetical protein
MIWLNWRLFRVHALVAAVALALITAYLLHLGGEIRGAYDSYRALCARPGDCAAAGSQFRSAYQSTLLFLAAGLALIPVAIGVFWGAPLISRELEAGTYRLVWNQSVTRRRWFLARLGFVGLAGMVVTGLAGALLTWAAAPYDRVTGERFGAIVFGARDVVPIGYAALAVTLGALVGLLVRRPLPAMAITAIAFLALQFAVPNLVRPHLMPPRETSLRMTARAVNSAENLGSITGRPVIGGLRLPGAPDAWISDTSPLRTANGRDLGTAAFNHCLDSAPKTGARGTFGDTAVCLARLDLHVDVQYQPADRYWPFQWEETALYVVLSALLAALGLAVIQRA